MTPERQTDRVEGQGLEVTVKSIKVLAQFLFLLVSIQNGDI